MSINPESPQTPRVLEEGRDYYLENGCWVFTAYYLKSRGYCCHNGCRHCPYGKDDAEESSPPKE